MVGESLLKGMICRFRLNVLVKSGSLSTRYCHEFLNAVNHWRVTGIIAIAKKSIASALLSHHLPSNASSDQRGYGALQLKLNECPKRFG